MIDERKHKIISPSIYNRDHGDGENDLANRSTKTTAHNHDRTDDQANAVGETEMGNSAPTATTEQPITTFKYAKGDKVLVYEPGKISTT